MKSRKRSGPRPPCKCKEVCPCHQPSKEEYFPWVFPFAFPIIFPLLFPGLFILVASVREPTVRHIEVDGKDCTIEWVNEGCTSTGACRGHDKAICE